ncbi:hypothetical protein [Aestuariivivens sediminicola]|uniref:hypothetical protein n=1 Tax=Aestuariivivens sediminicola TaxID=2913560 RepID=UPI001F590489|nr:hypothetical protein [Aestuariivivens sediminicola]
MIKINTFDDLLNFLDRDDITLEQASQVVTTFLNVVGFSSTIEELRIDIRKYIEKWGDTSERPLFYGVDLSFK